MITTSELHLNGFTFKELFHSEGLNRLDELFLTQLREKHPPLQTALLAYRNQTKEFTSQEISELLISCGYVLEEFLASLFNIKEEVAFSQIKTTEHNPISVFKKNYILRRAKKEMAKISTFPPFVELEAWLAIELAKAPIQTRDQELAVALLGMHYLNQPDTYKTEIEKLVQWSAYALTLPEAQDIVKSWSSFRIPERLDYKNLVPTIPNADDEYNRLAAPENTLRLRDGFNLTDPRMDARHVQDEINYCIYCHDHDGDFCSKGFPVKKGDPAQGFKKNPLDITLTGCPLEEKISEMHYLKKDGFSLASLAMIMVDNPMCPATGHRICNDCMKACIYQKQDPVNIPQIETRVLTDVLALPWGVEIYDLLTRWNPLRQKQWVMKPYNGLKVMIAGMGPAGFTLAHHLLLEGFAVVGFDGLKIEPLPQKLIHSPIYRFADLKESLAERLMSGFGGVAEYGITVRWDKNFLKLIYLSLMRRPYFQVFGGVRFGGTLQVEDAWEMGFDHFVIAVGAGLPRALPVPGSLAPGMRQANDFLMALQLGNAAKSSSLTNLQVRLPAVVIGGGLTGVDTATEIQAYYIAQVEKILYRYEILIQEYAKEKIHEQLDIASQEILAEYLSHGLAVREERILAKKHHRQPNFIKLIRAFGGVTIAYRRSMQESPAYVNNCEELQKALQEGIYYLEGLEPSAVQLNQHGHCATLVCQKRVRNESNEWVTTTEEVQLPAHSILVATGTQPNTAYEFEHRGTFNRLNLQYQHYEDEDGELNLAHGILHSKEPYFGPFTSYKKDNYRVSLIGDTHPVFHGSVVKAIASGMRTYPKILNILHDKLQQTGDHADYLNFAQKMQHLFQSKVISSTRKTNNILEITIQAPLAAKHFQAGEFYRLQNFETFAPVVAHTSLQMEPLALVAADVNIAKGTLTFIVKENTTTAKLCAILKEGESISLMGPAGVKAKIPKDKETILIIGNQASFAFLRSYGKAARARNCRIIYIAQLNHKGDLFCQKELEDSADTILWLTKSNEKVPVNREQDFSLSESNITTALAAYTKNTKYKYIPLADVDRIFIIGTTDMLRHFQHARKKLIDNYFIKNPKIIGSVYGNMQCMLKGVCAQCLQWQINPETGQRTKAVFACSWQDQPLEIIDIDHIDARHMQNRLHEQLSRLWVDYLFAKYDVNRIN